MELLKMLSDMELGLEGIRHIALPLLQKVKSGHLSTEKGVSFLEVKHLLLLSYCQCIVFLVFLKAQGVSIRGHPVLARFVELRLYLEKIRPVEKKLQYQIDKLLKSATAPLISENRDTTTAEKDDLNYRPNPSMLVSRLEEHKDLEGIYRPPKIAATSMEEDDPKVRRMKARQARDLSRRSSRSDFIQQLANDIDGKPMEIKPFTGIESRKLKREQQRLEDRAKQEEELFTRVPLSKAERKNLKHLKRSRNGLLGVLEDFNDDIGGLVGMQDDDNLNTEHKNTKSSKKHLHNKNRTKVQKQALGKRRKF